MVRRKAGTVMVLRTSIYLCGLAPFIIRVKSIFNVVFSLRLLFDCLVTRRPRLETLLA